MLSTFSADTTEAYECPRPCAGLSRDKRKLAKMVDGAVEHSSKALTIRDPYVFEFLGVHSDEVMPESRLEHALLDKLEAFLLELGRGFCFEARQRRILIGASTSSWTWSSTTAS